MIYYLTLILNYLICAQYKWDVGKVFNRELKMYPYFFIKNDSKINILFWDYYNENNLNNMIVIKCKDMKKIIKRSKTKFILDSEEFTISSGTNNYNLIRFDTEFIYYKFSLHSEFSINFKCDLKYWEFIYNGEWLINGTFITNIQLYDTDENDMYLNFLKPIVFVDLTRENINSLKFTNKLNLFNGGFNGLSNIKYSQLTSFYDNKVGVKWILVQGNQFISLDNKVFSFFNNRINKSFSVYINFDIIYKFLDKVNIITKDITISLYEILDNSSILLRINFRTLIKADGKFYLIINDSKTGTFFLHIIDYNITSQIDKDEMGVKFFIYTYYTNTKSKFVIGFKKDSNFIKNNEVLFTSNLTGISYVNIQDSSVNTYKHFIGIKKSTPTTFSNDDKVLYYFILNEYAIFTGGDIDETEITNNNVFLRIKGRYNILINNNKNLDRRFNLNNNNEVYPCKTFKCNICDINNKCLFCYYNYYLDSENNCILNTDTSKFVNDYSNLIEISEIIDDSEFTTTSDTKEITSNNKFEDLKLANVIIFLNFRLQSSTNNSFLNFQLNNPLNINYNIYFEENILVKPLTIFFSNANNFNNLYFEIINNNSYNLIINKNKRIIDCNNLDNEIIYKDMDCNIICSANSIQYFYIPINSKEGNCLKQVTNGFYTDSNNNVLKCPFNCLSCTYNSTDKKINCNKCVNGYKIIDGFCFFNNSFNCGENNDLNSIFDNNNSDDIIICDEFCNLCRQKKGETCSILNLNFDYCDINNINILKPNLDLIKENINKCEIMVNNECIKCNNTYFWNEIKLCIDCISNCLNCDNSFNCKVCITGFFINNGLCNLCESKFEDCWECNIDYCSKKKVKVIEIKCDVENCEICNEDNICSKCNKGYIVNNGTCKCNINNNYFLNINNDCLNCDLCLKCYENNKKICSSCLKCKTKVKFEVEQSKKEIIIKYNNNNIKILKNSSSLKIFNIINYIEFYNKDNIKIKVLDENIKNSYILIKDKIISEIKIGEFQTQNITLANYFSANTQGPVINTENNEAKVNPHQLIVKKYKFPNINLNNKLVSNTIVITTQTIDFSRFLIFFMPFIIFLNQTALIILFDTDWNENFVKLLKLIKKNNKNLIRNEIIFSSKDFKIAYERVKKKFKNNEIIGEINLLDIDFPIMFGLILIFYIVSYIFKKIKKSNKLIEIINNYKIYFKLIPLTLFQSYLIKNYYKIIFFSEIFFELKSYTLKILLFLWIQFYIIFILFYFNFHHFYCKLFQNPFFKDIKEYRDYKIIKLFVYFKKKETRNYNLIMNIVDFFIVLFFMELSNVFIIQIIMILLLTLFKMIYLIKLYFKYKKNRIFTQIISFIWLFNFYWLFFFNDYSFQINKISYLMILFFLFINIWEILRIVVYNLLKVLKKVKLKNILNIKKHYNNSKFKKNYLQNDIGFFEKLKNKFKKKKN